MVSSPTDPLVLGGASWNTIVSLDALPNGQPQTIMQARFHESVGSTGVGKALALAGLGHAPVLHAVLGQDTAARTIRTHLDQRGVRLIADTTGQPTAQHLNLMDPHGNRVSIFRAPDDPAPEVDTARLAPLIAQAEVIFLNITPSSIPLLPLVERARGPIWVDLHDYDGANHWHVPFIALADTLQLSDENLPDPADTVQHLLSGRASTVVLTRGGRGADIHTAEGCRHVLPIPATMRDANGAGDVFSVTLWHSLRAGHPLPTAADRAAAAAALCLESDSLVPDRLNDAAIAACLKERAPQRT